MMPWQSCARTVIVPDASVLAVALADDGRSGDLARDRLHGERLAAPEIIDLEVLSVLRRQLRVGGLDLRRAVLAVRDLQDLPLDRAPHQPLVHRCWELRDNLTPYDAAFVALAELLDVPVVTGDNRLARAPGLRCPIEVIGQAE
jgi:predicted nucleic acid-binding protein